MKILFATPEIAPFSSTGGLAYVSQSFPFHLRERGVDARIVAPKFGPGLKEHGRALREVGTLDIDVAGVRHHCTVELIELGGNLIYLIGNPHFFGREKLYGFADDAERFFFFCEAALRIASIGIFDADIFHANDWMTCFIPVLLRCKYGKGVDSRRKTLLSIRNLRYQGVFSKEQWERLGLSWRDIEKNGLDFYGRVNLLKLGIHHSDVIVTSSPSYAQEIQEPGYDPLTVSLRKRADDVFGIVEGVDVRTDDPRTDARIYRTYGSDDALEGKAANKAALQEMLALPIRRTTPLIGWINRLTSQKGVDLLRLAIDNGLLQEDVQLVICADGEGIFERFFRDLSTAHSDRLVYRNFEEGLAYKLYAASDMYLMPSTYEPGGISQLISMRYGAVPIVRETGGLRDTVRPYDPATGLGTGFVFDFRNVWVMLHKIDEARAIYQRKEEWRRIVANAMAHDCSWDSPIAAYIELFGKALGRSRIFPP